VSAVVPDGPACPNCGATVWTVGIVASTTEGAGTLDLMPAPMARCAGCNLSGRLDADDGIAWGS
jgi:hypothetical protein